MLAPIFERVVAQLAPWGFWGIFVGMLMDCACIPLPSELVLALGGLLAYRGHMTFGQALMAAQLGSLVGAAMAYVVGRWGGRPLLERYGGWLMISEQELAASDRWFARSGEWTVLLARLLPGARTLISIPAGVAGMDFSRFLLCSLLGMLPWTFAFIYIGYRLGENGAILQSALDRLDLVAGSALGVTIAWILWRKLRRK